MGCYTNLNWFSRRISDINNMPPQKKTVFYEVTKPWIPTIWVCEMFFFWFLPVRDLLFVKEILHHETQQKKHHQGKVHPGRKGPVANHFSDAQ